MTNPTILITGATGFVGQRLCCQLAENGFHLRVAVRRPAPLPYANTSTVVTGDVTTFTSWRQLVRGVHAVIHLVARTHVTDEFGTSALAAYRDINVDVTRRIAKAARQEQVRRFIYLSSIKAVANSSSTPLVEASPCRPVDSYGITKLEAEQVVRRQLLGSGTTYTILRPPLIYGPGVRGNFLRLLNLIQRGMPFPDIRNRRSMIHIDNLVDVLGLSVRDPAAFDQTFHVADRRPISTGDLVRSMGKGLGRRTRLLPFPTTLLQQIGRLTGKSQVIDRLTDSLVVSNETVFARLQWKPRIDIHDGIEQTSHAFARQAWTLEPQPTLPDHPRKAA